MSDKFNSVESRLTSLASPGIHPGLARLSKLLLLVGNPERSFRAVHIVGTNGKGSVAAALTSILISSGYKTALYTSPHLASFGERLKIDNKDVSAERWEYYTDKVNDIICSSASLMADRPTYFELITAIAFMIIAEENVDMAVVEAGLGGRLDATNIMKNVVLSLITPIGIDHTEYLGNTLLKIADEKFAVMRRDTTAIYAGGDLQTESEFAKSVSRSGAKGALLKDICCFSTMSLDLTGTYFNIKYNNITDTFHTPLIGFHQTGNAALAVMGATALAGNFKDINPLTIKDGIAKTCWPGRFEVVNGKLPLILDGAHNPHAMRCLVKTLKHIFQNKKINIILAMMRDKDIPESLRLLSQLNANIYCTEIPEMRRSMRAYELSEVVRTSGFDCVAEFFSPLDALNALYETGAPTICCGSLYLVGYLKKNSNLLSDTGFSGGETY